MSKIDKEQLIELIRDGKTDSECAEVFDCSNQAVSAMRRKLKSEGQLTTETIIDEKDYIAEKHLQTDDKPVTKTVAEYLAEEEAAEAAKRAEDTNALTTDDEICYEPVEPAPAPVRKFPLGVTPKKLWLEDRRDDLRRAICEFACEGLRIDPEWVAEYNELIERCEG